MKWILFALCCLLMGEGFAQGDKNGAKDFFKKVISTYFDSSFGLGSYVNDSIILISPNYDTVFGGNIFKIEIAGYGDVFQKRVRGWVEPFKNIDDFLNNYEIFAYNKAEFTNDSNLLIANEAARDNPENTFALKITSRFKRHYTNDDYFVFGNVPIDKSKPFISGLFLMIVRKTKSGWKISGIPG